VVMLMAWLIPVVIGLVVLGAVLGWFRPAGRRPREDVRWVANTSYLSRLPTYRKRLRLYRVALAGLGVFLLVTTLGAALLTARPVDREVRAEVLASRDVVLCLDVSGSMIEFATEIVETFSELVESFEGERISLSIWNTTSRSVFPLTDDYTLVTEELAAAAEALDFDLNNPFYSPEAFDRLEEYVTGTMSVDPNSSSLVGDGLASCVYAFPETDTERSRSIILATDNQVLGQPIYTLQEAADLAAERDIRLYGLFTASPQSYTQQNEDSYRQAITEHGGLFYHADDPGAVEAIIEDITSQQAVELDADPEVVITDRPETVLWIAAAGVGGIILAAWRLRS